jgi:hypothetical protein
MFSSPSLTRPAPRPQPRELAPVRRSEPVHVPGSLEDDFGRNPVARAYRRGAPDRDAASSSLAGRALLFGVVLPALIFLVAGPIGWILLAVAVLGLLLALPALAM